MIIVKVKIINLLKFSFNAVKLFLLSSVLAGQNLKLRVNFLPPTNLNYMFLECARFFFLYFLFFFFCFVTGSSQRKFAPLLIKFNLW